MNNNEYIHQINLNCLISKENRHKLSASIHKPTDINKKDKRFYRKRVLNLTKELLLNSPPECLFPDIKLAYVNYVNACIGYFKVIDETDIIQSDHVNLENIITDELTNAQLDENDDLVTVEEANKLMMRSIKINHITLDKFVKVTNRSQYTPIIPQQKDINLLDPVLKNKGIRKKKNIYNKYGEKQENIENIEKKETNA